MSREAVFMQFCYSFKQLLFVHSVFSWPSVTKRPPPTRKVEKLWIGSYLFSKHDADARERFHKKCPSEILLKLIRYTFGFKRVWIRNEIEFMLHKKDDQIIAIVRKDDVNDRSDLDKKVPKESTKTCQISRLDLVDSAVLMIMSGRLSRLDQNFYRLRYSCSTSFGGRGQIM